MTNDSYKITSQMFRNLFPAQIVTAVVPLISELIDTFIAGNMLDSSALAAIGFVAPVTFIFSAVSCLMSSGLSIAAGKYIGHGEYDKLYSLYTSAIIFFSMIALAFLSFSIIFSTQILILLGTDENVIELTKDYLIPILFGIIPTIINPVCVVLLNFQNDAKYTAFVTGVIAALNSLLSVFLVLYASRSIISLGIATTISLFIGLFCYLYKLHKKKVLHSITGGKFDIHYIKEIVFYGLPSSSNWLFAGIRITILNKSILYVGGLAAVSAYSVFNSVSGIFCAAINGTTGTVQLLSGIAVGKQISTGFRDIINCVLKISVPINLIFALLLGVLAEPIGIIFGLSDMALNYIKICCIAYALALCLELMCDEWMAILSSLGRFKLVTISYFIVMVVFPFAVCHIGKALQSFHVIMLSYFISALLILLIMTIISCVKNKSLPRRLIDLIWLDDKFDESKNQKIDISITSLNDAVAASGKLIEFCSTNGIDKRRSYYAGLCIEEMAINIIEKGFSRNGDAIYSENPQNDGTIYSENLPDGGTIDILASINEDGMRIMLSDNAPYYNPIERMEMYKADPLDLSSNVGIRLVSGIAKEMKYSQIFGTNSLTIDI